MAQMVVPILAGAAIGAGSGYLMGEDDDDIWKGAIVGGVAGGVGGAAAGGLSSGATTSAAAGGGTGGTYGGSLAGGGTYQGSLIGGGSTTASAGSSGGMFGGLFGGSSSSGGGWQSMLGNLGGGQQGGGLGGGLGGQQGGGTFMGMGSQGWGMVGQLGGLLSGGAQAQSGAALQEQYMVMAQNEQYAAQYREVQRKERLLKALASQNATRAAQGVRSYEGSPAAMMGADMESYYVERYADEGATSMRVRSYARSGAVAQRSAQISAGTSLLEFGTKAAMTQV